MCLALSLTSNVQKTDSLNPFEPLQGQCTSLIDGGFLPLDRDGV